MLNPYTTPAALFGARQRLDFLEEKSIDGLLSKAEQREMTGLRNSLFWIWDGEYRFGVAKE